MKTALDLAEFVMVVTNDIADIMDSQGVDFDEVHFNWPEWWVAMERNALDYVALMEDTNKEFLLAHERDIMVGLPHWWTKSGPQGEGARSVFVRRARAVALRKQTIEKAL